MRIGLLGVAHLHVTSYVGQLRGRSGVTISGVADPDPARAREFAARYEIPAFAEPSELIAHSDAVIVCSENAHHARLVALCAEAGKPVMVEKPIGISEEDFRTLEEAARKVPVMTAFPCRFSPTYQALKRRVNAGEIGPVRAIMATNRGQCPGGWFVQRDLSGGGAMIDHVVHVADLLRDLLGEEPETVSAEVGHNVYGEEWEDTAMVSLKYPSGVFATLDSSWSRPKDFETWGDVTMTVVGESGVIEADLFGQGLTLKGRLHPYGSDLDGLMVAEFLRAARDGAPEVSAADGIAAARVALAGYHSLE